MLSAALGSRAVAHVPGERKCPLSTSLTAEGLGCSCCVTGAAITYATSSHCFFSVCFCEGARCVQAILVFLPVDPPVWAQQFTRWALARSVAYFPTTLHVEEELRLGRQYVVGAPRAWTFPNINSACAG